MLPIRQNKVNEKSTENVYLINCLFEWIDIVHVVV